MIAVLKKYPLTIGITAVFLALGFQYIRVFTTPLAELNLLEALPSFYLSSNTTNAGLAAGTLFTATNSTGFSVGASALVNTNGNSYISWAMKEDATSGLDIVTYTGNGANRTVSHNLADTPDAIFIKRTDSAANWTVWHKSLATPTTQYLVLNSTAIATADATMWNSTTPTTTDFSLGTNALVNANAGTFIAYVFAEKEGFSKIGSYTGNGNADGAFVYTGFKPKWIMVKRTTTTVDSWHIFDTTRSTVNPTATVLFADTTAIDTALANGMDINSNGFKLRTTDAGINTSGATYVYMAFAEYPFKEQFTPNGYSINNSVRFNGTNGFLTRTQVAGDRQKWTWSGWIKKSRAVSSANNQGVFVAGTSSSNFTGMRYQNAVDDGIRFCNVSGAGCLASYVVNDTNSQRDPAEWHHYVFVQDTTQATAANRIRWYKNGVETTYESAPNYPAQNSTFDINEAGDTFALGCQITALGCLDGYMAEINFIDGQALSPTDFGQFDSNGVWRPKAYTGTYISDTAKHLTTFLANGFTVLTNAIVNTLSDTYISWSWDESVTSGLDVVTYTGTGANRTVSHNLADTPDAIFIKRTDSAANWTVWHKSLATPTTQYLVLNSTAIAATDATMWNSTTPTTTDFSLGTNALVNANAGSFIAYVFAEKEGFSKIGSYTGNGNADGAFVYTGFKPKWIMIKKSTTAVDSWHIFDTTRSTFNPTATVLFADTTAIDTALANGMDINSNGFKLRTTDAGINTSGATYVYMAFAEYPFKELHTPDGYSITNSAIFNGTNESLSRTPASDGNLRTWTISAWVKSYRNDDATIFGSAVRGGVVYDHLNLYDTGKIANGIGNVAATAADSNFSSDGVYRDKSKWHHIVWRYDTTQATASDRSRMYLDGVLITDSTPNDPTLNFQTIQWNNAGQAQTFARDFSGTGYGATMLSEIHFLDGISTDPTAFGQFDANGNWKPKAYSGAYGSNGYRLNFSDSSNLGLDSSGNANHFTANNMDATNQTIDSPTKNFATFNANSPQGATFNNGALEVVTDTTASTILTTIALPLTGKHYWEVIPTAGTGAAMIGIASVTNSPVAEFSSTATGYGYAGATGQVFTNSVGTAYGATYANNDVIGVAYDADNGRLFFSKNGVWQNSGNPAAGTNPAYTGLSGQFMPAVADTSVTLTRTYVGNFGQLKETVIGGVNTYDAAADGYFKYTPPTGFKALSTANMTAATIPKGSTYFDTKGYTGTGASLSVTSLGFQPELVWIKDRTTANNHGIFASATTPSSGTYCYLGSNLSSGLTCAQSNSFYLNFADANDPGNDVSGLNNDFTNNNILTTDNVIDTPTKNFATLNAAVETGTRVLTQGNLRADDSGSGTFIALSTIKYPATGKWYWEGTFTTVTASGGAVGIVEFSPQLAQATGYNFSNTSNTDAIYVQQSSNQVLKVTDGVQAGQGTFTVSGNEVVGVALDLDAGEVSFYRNGVLTVSAVSLSGLAPNGWFPFIDSHNQNGAITVNFGQGGQSGLTYDAAADGYFKYTPPTGFKALSTANLPSATITKGSNYFDAKSYTGNGTAQTISGFDFEPQFLWVKNRSVAQNHALFGDGTIGGSATVNMMWFEL